VLGAARALLAEEGSAGLTMRALAARLGVAPNTLYSHVADKTELVDLVLDDVLGGVPLPAAGTAEADPVGAVRAVMLASYDVLVTHADLMPHFLARQGARGERAVRLGEVTLDALARAGVAGQQGRDALRVLIVNTIGFAAFSAGGGVLPAGEVRATHERALDWLLAGITAG
jgi:AcrR family transcriptional regulator